MKLHTKDLIFIALSIALCIISTTILIPLPTGGMVHLGSAALFLIASIFGGLYGALTGAIASGLFDFLMGHMSYTLFSVIIKGLAGLVVGLMTVGFWPPKNNQGYPSLARLLIAMIVGALVTAFGYFIAWYFVLGSLAAATAALPSSFLTSGVGIIIAILLVPQLQKPFRKLLNSNNSK